MVLVAYLSLIVPALLGTWAIRRLLGDRLTPLVSLCWGLVLGWAGFVTVTYALTLALGRLQPAVPALVTEVATVGLGGLVWRHRRSRPAGKWRQDLPLLLVLGVFGSLIGRLFAAQFPDVAADGGLHLGGKIFYDGPFHMMLAAQFRYGANYPPVYPILPPLPLHYPFLPDFHTAVLMALGCDWWQALFLTALPLALAMLGILYGLTLVIVPSAAVATIATCLFPLNGGLTFLHFLEAYRQSDHGFWTFLMQGPYFGTLWDVGVIWSNLIVECLLPQRPALYGLPLMLMVLTLFALCWRFWAHGDPDAAAADARRWLLLAGILTGSLALFHSLSLIATGLVAAGLFLTRPRWAWLAFATPVLFIAVPHLLTVVPQATQAGFVHLRPGWMWDHRGSFLLFLVNNFGVPLLLAIPAWWQLPRPWRSFYPAFVGLLAFSLTVMVSPADDNNMKLFYGWYAVTCVIVAAWLVKLARTHGQTWLASLLFLGCIASAGLTIVRANDRAFGLFPRAEVVAARQLVRLTPPEAVFLTAQDHNHPVACLAGRRLWAGYPLWCWSHGYSAPLDQRLALLPRLMAGGQQALILMRQQGIDYVYLSPLEDRLKPNRAYFDTHFPVVYRQGTITVYRVPPPGTLPPDQRRAPTPPRRTDASPPAPGHAPPVEPRSPWGQSGRPGIVRFKPVGPS